MDSNLWYRGTKARNSEASRVSRVEDLAFVVDGWRPISPPAAPARPRCRRPSFRGFSLAVAKSRGEQPPTAVSSTHFGVRPR